MEKTKQFLLTVSAGKRLIAKAMPYLEQIDTALKDHTVVIISGSTNGYVAEEILTQIGQKGDFDKKTFWRGVNAGPGAKLQKGAYSDCDIVIEKGVWVKGKTIFDVVQTLGVNDVILKGANAVQADRKQAGIQIGNPMFGTSGPILEATLGKRTQLVIPVGLEKRIFGSISEIASKINKPSASGTRLLPIGGTIITELEAVNLISGASAEIVAAGGVFGAEGGYWIAATGTEEQLDVIIEVIKEIQPEPVF